MIFSTLARALSCALILSLIGCGGPTAEEMERYNSDDALRVQFYSNSPGTRRANERDRRPDELLVEAIDRAEVSLDACVYGFSKRNVIDAVVRAFYRGVRVRVVGDARHFGYGERGYRAMQRHRIPMQVGNQFHIMHNKFFVIDDRFTFVGTGNITTTGFEKNSNNWLLIDSQAMARDFGAEFDQMFAGRFSNAKVKQENGNRYEIGDTTVEVLFSPQEDTMGKILAELDRAHTSVHFQNYPFTKDQVGSRFVRKHQEFTRYNESVGMADRPVIDLDRPWQGDDEASGERPKKVVGILDKSQLHGNGQFHEAYRLIANKIPMRIDANANSYIPGDYQAGGGRLHTKTMILDYGTPDARVVTGSFNWSSAATIANDEVLMVLRGERIVEQFMRSWRELWITGAGMPQAMCEANLRHDEYKYKCGDEIDPGDVVISEVHWDGWNDRVDPADQQGRRDPITNDEFVELYNTTDRTVDLSLWSLTNGHDVTMGFTPGTVIRPGEHFLVLDHNLEPFLALEPQRGTGAFRGADFVLNASNDPRFPRLNLSNTALRLELRAPVDTTGPNSDVTTPHIIDAVGDFGPPFAGGRVGDKVYSMERLFVDGKPAPGEVPSSWRAPQADQGNGNVNEAFRDFVIATPGAPNSVN